MGFWIFMTVMALLIPAIMIIIGWLFSRKAPGKINHFFGYRTRRSMINRDTWEFAHKYCGKLWLKVGTTMAVLSIIPMIAVFGKDEDTTGMVGTVVELIQVMILLLSIIPVERALKKTFDDNGNRK